MPEPIQATTSEPTPMPTNPPTVAGVDARARLAILRLAERLDNCDTVWGNCHKAEARDILNGSPTGDDIPGTTPPHPPAAQSGEEWRSKCSRTRQQNGKWDIHSPTGTYYLANHDELCWRLVHSPCYNGDWDTIADAYAALTNAPQPPDWTPAPPASEKASGFCTHMDLPNGVVWSQTGWYLRLRDGHWRWVCDLTEIDTDAVRAVRAALASESAPTPKADPKPIPWPDDLTTLVGKRIKTRVNSKHHLGYMHGQVENPAVTSVDISPRWLCVSGGASGCVINTTLRDLLSIEDAKPKPAPKDAESVGEDWLPEGLGSARARAKWVMAAGSLASGADATNNHDNYWRAEVRRFRDQLAAMTKRAEAAKRQDYRPEDLLDQP